MKHETIAELTRCLVGISIGQLPPEKTWIQHLCKVIDTDNQALEAKYSEAVGFIREIAKDNDFYNHRQKKAKDLLKRHKGEV